MNRNDHRPVRVAHAFGNRRSKIEETADADIDFIEVDLWFRANDVWARHERRLGPIPLLFDRRPRGVESVGPCAITIFPNYYARLDVRPLRLVEVLERTQGRCGVLLDIKGSEIHQRARAYARTLAAIVDPFRGERLIVCGQSHPVLHELREVAPHLDVRPSIEKDQQWQSLQRLLKADGGIRGVCMHRNFLDDHIAGFLEDNELEVFCWTVDDADEARSLVGRGVDGIISNNLSLLKDLSG